jgi:hypothetical protein
MTDPEKNLQSLDQRLESLPRELPPERDLWPDIAARIGDPKLRLRGVVPASRPGFRTGWRLLAAAAAVALVAVLGIHVYFGDGEFFQDPPPQAALAPEVLSTFGPGHALGSGYQAARAGLADDLERRLEALPPETRATVLENLEAIRQAVAEINAALGDDPSNVLLQHQLLAAYQDELAVLAHLNRLTDRLPPRNEI